MNDRIDFERLVNERFAREHDVRPPDRAVDQILTEAGRVRPLPRWLALIKEPSMRYSSSLAVGSPTFRAAAILAATLLLALALIAAGIAGSRLLAADDAIIVDQSGGGDYTTISDAVSAALDGDTIRIRPGEYVEALLIDKDITITGDGPVDEIVLSAPADVPIFEGRRMSLPYAVLLDGIEAELSGLTLSGEGSTIVVSGGAPVLSGLVFDRVNEQGRNVDDQRMAVTFIEGSSGTLRGSMFVDSDDVHVNDSAPLIEDNSFSGGSSIWGGMENDTVIRGNRIDGSLGASIYLQEATEALIEGNTITGPLDEGGIWVKGGPPPGVTLIVPPNDPETTIRGNIITTGEEVPGIFLTTRMGGTITDNTIETTGIGIVVERGSTTVISDNAICAGVSAFDVEEPNEVDIGENELCDEA